MTTERFSAPPRSMPFEPGAVLAGKYKVERLLGQGGMGWVVVATHVQLEQRVALKFMHPEQAIEHPDSVGRFLREARAAARIQSEYVARVSDFGTLENGSPYLVMEYLEGHDLEAELRTAQPLPLRTAIDYAIQACEGLAEAHAAGIVHRDLKPGNLFLARRSDGSLRVKLLDFGISKLAPVPGGSEEKAMTSTQALMGSPLYMSPEQLRSSKNVDRRADIWSLGIIVFEMLAGRAPFDGETLPEVCARIMAEPPTGLRELRAEVPPGLEAVVMRCLEKDPQKRFQDVAALAQGLAPFGAPEMRAAAERIARLVRARDGGQTDSRVDVAEREPPSVATAVSGIAQTNASFTASGEGPAAPRRSAGPRRWLLGGGVVAGLVAVVIGLVSTRGRHPEPAVISPASPPPSPTGVVLPSTATAAAGVASGAPAATGAAPAAATEPSASAMANAPATTGQQPTPPHAPAQPAPPHAAAQPATVTPSRTPPKPKPAATATAAKPASTSGFGGRD